MAKTTPTEAKIIETTIQCIEQYGIPGTTIRKIAELAGVNSAAISYYFRSKDVLVAKALDITLQNGFNWEDFAVSEALPAPERLAAILEILVEGALKFPGIVRAHFHELLINGNYDIPAVKQINTFLERLVVDLRSRGLGIDEAQLRLKLIQLASATFLLAALTPNLYASFNGFNLSDPETRKHYIHSLVEQLLEK